MALASDSAQMTSPIEGPLRCASCEYDLTGLPETGRCPECSYSIDESVRYRGGWTVRRLRMLQLACVSFAVAWCPWLAFGLTMLLRPTPFLRMLVGAFIIAHVLLLEASMLAATTAGSMRPPRGRLLIMALTTLPMLACAILLSLLIVQWISIGPTPERVVVASAVSRSVIVWFAVWWLTRSHRSLTSAGRAWRGVQLVCISISLAMWLGSLVLMALEMTGVFGSGAMAFGGASFEWSQWAMVIDIAVFAIAGIGALRLGWLAQCRIRAIRSSAPAA